MGQQNRGCEKCCHCCYVVTEGLEALVHKGSGDDSKNRNAVMICAGLGLIGG